MRGVLDSANVMEPKVRQVLLDLAASWPNKAVREAAAERLVPSATSDHMSSPPSMGDRHHDQGRSMPANRQPALF
jgi:hypothetical protein